MNYGVRLAAMTQGKGAMSLRVAGYEPCHQTGAVVEQRNYNKNADPAYSSASIFVPRVRGMPCPGKRPDSICMFKQQAGTATRFLREQYRFSVKSKERCRLTMTNVIDKVAWIYVVDGKVLGARSQGKDTYYFPGGKREPGETDAETLVREIEEELSVQILPETIAEFGSFEAPAHGKAEGIRADDLPDRRLHRRAYPGFRD